MGGVGKTELAIHYARQHEADYPGGILWLNARESNLAAEVVQSAQLYMNLEVPQQYQGRLLTLKEKVEWCWQNWQPPLGLVLVVLDDVTDLANCQEALPGDSRFRVLMTTRLRNLDAKIQDLPLDVLSASEAIALLTSLIGERRVQKEMLAAEELCQWLGYLPLGLELVGRYLSKKPPHWSIAKMLQKLKAQSLEDEALNTQLQQTLSTAQRGVLAAFELSWKELSPTTQLISELLSLFALDIFLWVWVESIAQKLDWVKLDVETANEQLYQHHLIEYVEEIDGGYRIHPLIREFLQRKQVTLTAADFLSQTEQSCEQAQGEESRIIKQVYAAFFRTIAEKVPHQPNLSDIESVKLAIPHLEEVAQNLVDTVEHKDLAWIFSSLVKFYQGQGLYILAEGWCQQYLSVMQSRLGENHPFVATSLNDLAGVYRDTGRYEQAEPLYIQALEICKQLLGENHSDVATSLNNLALLYRDTGRYEQAEPLYIQALEMRKRLLGENHPDVATSLNDLAGVYIDTGRYEQAEPLYVQALEIRKRLLGENHPYVATSLNGLGLLYRDTGRYEQAEPLFIQALEIRKRLLGENHPDVATSLNNLAGVYTMTGRYEQAEPLYVQALEMDKRLLGENHPYVATSLNDLGLLYRDTGRYEQAEPLYVQALKIYKQLLGENHPNVATSLNNLAELYRKTERYEQAEPLYVQALEIRKRLLGENHPDVATSLNNLAGVYRDTGRYEQAEPLYVQALKIYKQRLGDTHPYTLTVSQNLESLRAIQASGNQISHGDS